MSVSAADVKALREATGAGMMDCKKALVDTGGDIEAAKKLLREKGLAAAAKRAGRAAAEGLVVAEIAPDGRSAALVEVNCETDFVAKGDRFGALAAEAAAKVFAAGGVDGVAGDLDALVEDAKVELQENLQFSRGEFYAAGDDGVVEIYLHRTGGWPTKGVMIEIDGAGVDPARLSEIAHEVALHVQFARPSCLTADEVPQSILDGEREIAEAKARNEGKPDDIVPKIADGAVKKYLKEQVLSDQPFVKNDKRTVAQWVADESDNKARIVRFVRFEVGEGVEADSGD
jgi:elongation factor Ts